MKIKNLPKLLSIIVIVSCTYIVAGESDEIRNRHRGSHHFEGKVGGGRDAYDMHDINGAKGNVFVQGDRNFIIYQPAGKNTKSGASLNSDPERIYDSIREKKRLPSNIPSEAYLVNKFGRLPEDIKKILHRK